MRTQDDEQYLRSAIDVIRLIDDIVTISPSARVLDVGCGAGRLALPLLEHLDRNSGGSYVGFDVKEERIEWARQHISAYYPHFRFQFINVLNTTLNPSGTVDGALFPFPYEDGRFDLILYHSVFTHLLPAETRHYLAESARCLAPAGRIYSTWYLWDEATKESVRTNEVLWSFPEDQGNHRVVDAVRPELAVAYVYEPLVQELRRNELRIVVEKRGNWRSRPTHDQDMLVLAHTE